MLEAILSTDLSVFYAINKGLSNPVCDIVMPVLTNTIIWIPIITAFMLYQFFKGGVNGKVCIVALILVVGICDQVSSGLIKSLVMRPRPCHTLSDLNLLVNCGAGKSFPSSHASNSMAVVVMIALFFRKHKFWLPILSLIIGFSRVYVGVHYPLDVLCGWILGAGIAILVYKLVMLCFNKYIQPRLSKRRT